MEKMILWIDGPPQAKGRPIMNTYTKKARTPDKTRDYESYIAQVYMLKYLDRLFFENTALKMSVYAYFIRLPRARSAYPVQKDLDNIIKIIADGLNKVAYDDDRHIVTIEAHKCFVDDEKDEGVLVVLEDYTNLIDKKLYLLLRDSIG